MEWDVVIGVETHIQLSTLSKLTCSCAVVPSAHPPNSSVCPICMGLPGALPTINKNACKKAIMAGLCTECSINQKLAFDRKNYFYPDLPKSYQITQDRYPICLNGFLDILDLHQNTKRVRIQQIHLEEDAGKLLHVEKSTFLDFNRAGVPLIEVVTHPDMSTALEVDMFLKKLRSLLMYAGVSECRMQEGEMRADINISLKPKGSSLLGVRTELKNMNTFKGISLAIECEIVRQKAILESGKTVEMQTLAFDVEKRKIIPMRYKENADEYRYMMEFDISPLEIEQQFIESIRQEMQELPEARYQRFLEDYELSPYDASILVEDKGTSDYYEKSCAHDPTNSPKKIANWILTEVLSVIKHHQWEIEQFAEKISPAHLSELVALCESGTITGKIAKSLFVKMLETGKSPQKLQIELGISVLSDETKLREISSQIMQQNPKAVQQCQQGSDRVLGFFVGEVMKITKGQADPQVLQKILKELLAKCSDDEASKI